jgi:hypothetical protein
MTSPKFCDLSDNVSSQLTALGRPGGTVFPFQRLSLTESASLLWARQGNRWSRVSSLSYTFSRGMRIDKGVGEDGQFLNLLSNPWRKHSYKYLRFALLTNGFAYFVRASSCFFKKF